VYGNDFAEINFEINQRPPAEVAPVPSRGHPHTPALLVVADLPTCNNDICILGKAWIVSIWSDENSHIGALNFHPIFIPHFERKVSGVSVQDMLLRLPFLTPETRHLKPNSQNKTVQKVKSMCIKLQVNFHHLSLNLAALRVLIGFQREP
jgi:hypothetical protein